MFDSPEDAYRQLADAFTRPQAEIIVKALVPAIGFVPVPGGRAVLGGTRIGGTPDLPPGLDWPKRAKPADAEAIAKRGSQEAGKAMAEHFRLELPYAFLVQVDLGEAAALGPVARDLPQEGRLLFFYDLMSGPYETGTETARVLWDQAPRDTLTAQTLPPALAAAALEERESLATAFTAQGSKLPGPIGSGSSTPYDSPARPMRLEATLRLPDDQVDDMDAQPPLKALWEEGSSETNTFREAYRALIARGFDRHYDAANPGHRNQMLGSPNPEQDDPRYDAVVVTRFGVQHLDRETWKARFPEIRAEAKNWRLLLQIDCSDHAQDDLVEGTVYILIRDEDLKARRFDKAVAVYQQT